MKQRLYTRRSILSILMIFVLLAAVCLPVASGDSYQKKEFRAVWVSTVYNLDYPSRAGLAPEALKQEADQILENSRAMGMTAVILQVRPSADSFYPSAYFPWSKYLTGGQDTAPADHFDPLAYWVEKAHALGLELHAWINPYRITQGKEAEYEALSDSHPAKLHPDWVLKADDGNYYFDPGRPEVRSLVIDSAKEIVENYAVDGLHMDDYFYPTVSFDDSATFAQYAGAFTDVGDWRRDNVNQLISGLDAALHQVNPALSFGISPAGIWANSSSMPGGSATSGNETYFAHYADTKKWVEQGWVDYICPQIYWNIGLAVADYSVLTKWWSDVVQNTDVDLYIGMADYKAGNEDPESAWYGVSEIERQLIWNQTLPQIKGEAHFRYRFLVENSDLFALYQNYYTGEVVLPTPSPSPTLEPMPTPTPSPSPTPEPTQTPGAAQPLLDKVNHNAYIKGDGQGYFRPDASITRGEAAILFARLMVDESGTPLLSQVQDDILYFTDVSKDDWYADAVSLMAGYGILNGYEDGTFRPNQPITRAEFAVIASHFEEGSSGLGGGFSDIDSSHFAYRAVLLFQQKGWISGYPDGTFRPDQGIKRAEAVKVTNRILERLPDQAAIDGMFEASEYLDTTIEHWAYYEVMEAACSHLYQKADGAEQWISLL